MVEIKLLNADTFRKKMKEVADELEIRASDVIRNLVPAVVEELALRSPVGETDNPAYGYNRKPLQSFEAGWYSSNWQVNFSPDSTPRTNRGETQGIPYSIDQALVSMQGFTVKGTPNIYITNPVPYAEMIEEGHSSRKAPDGVLNVVIELFPKLVTDAINTTAQQRLT